MSLFEAVFLLAAAVIVVPLSKRLGFAAVLGFLLAGVVLGPWGLGLVADVERILHFAELGVVFLLFLIGLELQPSRLWALRHAVFGLGAAQVGLTSLLFSGIAWGLGLAPLPALFVGIVLSFSSTAFALQLLAEKNALTTHHGRSAFAILLFQDMAAVPLIALVPVLAGEASGMGAWPIARALLVLAAVVVAGRFLLRPVLHIVAASRTPEVFTAATLLVVIGTALIMQAAGLSMALGAFMAGVLLAESEFRHELEANIEPFKGLLLGLFFMAVGLAMDLRLIGSHTSVVLGLVAGLLLIKGLVLYAIGRVSGHAHASALRLALFTAQGGEFAFILFGAAGGARLLDETVTNMLVVAVSLSMALTPLLVGLAERWLGRTRPPAPEYDHIDDDANPVIIAGFGRVGQVIARILRVKKIPFTALEANFEQVDFVRKFGNKIYFGDASRVDLLRAAKAERAKIFVLAIDDIEASIKTAETVRRHYPHLVIYARARNRYHTYKLLDLGVEKIVRETFFSSLAMAQDVLQGLGATAHDAATTVEKFHAHDRELLRKQHLIHHDEAELIQTTRQAAEELEGLFEEDTQVERRRRE